MVWCPNVRKFWMHQLPSFLMGMLECLHWKMRWIFVSLSARSRTCVPGLSFEVWGNGWITCWWPPEIPSLFEDWRQAFFELIIVLYKFQCRMTWIFDSDIFPTAIKMLYKYVTVCHLSPSLRPCWHSPPSIPETAHSAPANPDRCEKCIAAHEVNVCEIS